MMIILQKILLGIESNVIPLQLLQFVRSPFLGILTIDPLVQSMGSSSFSQISANSGSSTLAAEAGSALKSSAGNSSLPGALLFFKELIAFRISSLFGGFRFTVISWEADWISSKCSGSGLFRTFG